ncbi:MAG: class I SAM-dependent RNA methyltransferase [Sphingomonadaceae bacterium]
MPDALITRIAARGDGVTDDGRFFAGTAPGDTVNPDGGIIPGPHRAPPVCRHFGQCGGCQLQHVDDAAYAQFLIDRIVEALHAQALSAPPIATPHLSPPRTRRRATMRAERRGKAIALGFNEATSNRIVDLRECHVILPALFEMVQPLRTLLATLLRERERATVIMTNVDQGIDLLLSGFEAEGLAANEALSSFAECKALARLSLDEGYGPAIRAMPTLVTITLSGVPVAFPEGAFLQATADGETALVAAVRTALDGAAHVADLFAGLGTFALALGTRTHAVEGNRDAVLALKATGRVAVEHRDLFRRPMTRSELTPFDAVVLDPPRAGAVAQVAELAASAVPRIAYVSCNPATFARDARVLVAGGYRLEHITPVGQFRWSTHVELAAAFAR